MVGRIDEEMARALVVGEMKLYYCVYCGAVFAFNPFDMKHELKRICPVCLAKKSFLPLIGHWWEEKK